MVPEEEIREMLRQIEVEQIVLALEDRIKQIDESLEVIPTSNSCYWRQEAVREELQTLLGWILGDDDE